MKNIVQFTGLSSVGKTTLAAHVSEKLVAMGFSKRDRLEHLRRLACLAVEVGRSHFREVCGAGLSLLDDTSANKQFA